jgi:hypothetical protein
VQHRQVSTGRPTISIFTLINIALGNNHQHGTEAAKDAASQLNDVLRHETADDQTGSTISRHDASP